MVNPYDKKAQENISKAFENINNYYADMIGEKRNKNSYLYFSSNKPSCEDRYFYTPWKTKRNPSEKAGYLSGVYRYYKSKNQFRALKVVRSATRKKAQERALKLKKNYY